MPQKRSEKQLGQLGPLDTRWPTFHVPVVLRKLQIGFDDVAKDYSKRTVRTTLQSESDREYDRRNSSW